VTGISKMSSFPRWFTRLVFWGRQVDPPRKPLAYHSGHHKQPIVIFTSGLYGSLEMYTQLGREVAAEGAIVLAVEHEDGSGIYATNSSTGRPIYFRKRPPDYNFSAGRDAVIAWRKPFLDKRVQELRDMIECLSSNLAAELDTEEKPTDPSAALLRELLLSANSSQIILMGHSLGAAGAVLAMQNLSCSELRGAVLYDPWLTPVSDEALSEGVRFPYTTFLSGEWEGYDNELQHIERLRAGCPEMAVAAAVVRGSKHQWISDAHLWLPRWLLRRLGLLGLGDYHKVRAATVKSTSIAIKETLREMSTGLQSPLTIRANINRDLQHVSPSILVPLERPPLHRTPRR